MSSKKVKTVITSALPYANGPIHIGHLVEYIQTDIYVRFLKMAGEDVIYCCADDTHGTPIEINAFQKGISPNELIEYYYKEHTKDFKDFDIEFDSYYSTNSPENKEFSDLFFSRFVKNGDIEKKEVELTYCKHCKRFLPDRFVKGECPKCGAKDQYGDHCEVCNATYSPIELINSYCIICKNPPTRKKSVHYFFKLSNYAEKLKKWLIENKRLQKEIKNYVLNWIEEGLKDWDITRDAPYFGFNILGEKNKYYYVWLDAPIGYIASTKHYCDQHNLDYRLYWEDKNGRIIHFIGKDIIYFHFLFWPAQLMAAGFNLPYNIVVHGFLTLKKEKMSKSRGHLISAREYLDKLDPNYLRFYYACNLSHSMSDINFDPEQLKNRVNSQLIGNFANFANRTLTFLKKNFDGKVGDFNDEEPLKKIKINVEKILAAYRDIDFRQVINLIMEIGDIGNNYMQSMEPWRVIKEDKKKAHEIVALCFHILKQLCILMKPIVPSLCKKLEKQLNLENLTLKDLEIKTDKTHEIGSPSPLIQMITEIPFLDVKEKPDPIELVELKVAKVEKAFEHPNSDKLMVLSVSLGKEIRQIVAGIRNYYSPKELIGKNIIIIANLKPAIIRGYKSNGMLLAAVAKDKMGLLTIFKASPGDPVEINGLTYKGSYELSINEFKKISIVSEGEKILYKGKILKVKGEKVKADRNVKGKVS